uniref:PAT complex subunit CCDC47 n=1 Tax=Trichuris muris TaxID=70415 RepID=A0A5S6QI74_TRIMR
MFNTERYLFFQAGRFLRGYWCFSILIILHLLFGLTHGSSKLAVDHEDNEFAEFEEFDVDQDLSHKAAKGVYTDSTSLPADAGPLTDQPEAVRLDEEDATSESEDYGIVEDDFGDEFSPVIDQTDFVDTKAAENDRKNPRPAPTLKIADVPAQLKNWHDYSVELGFIVGLLLYMVNYVYGKTKNFNLASAWFDANRDFLAENFSIVGDDGLSQEVNQNVMIKESDSSYAVWCSGRQGCFGMLAQLKLIKRQDLSSVLIGLFRPRFDTLSIKFTLCPEDMDPYVFAVGQRRSLVRVVAESSDLSMYCSEKKSAEKLGLPSNFTVYSELGEVAANIVDPKFTAAVAKYPGCIDYLHISDQYVASKPNDSESTTKPPVTSKVVIFVLNIPGKLNAAEKDVLSLKPLLPLAFHIFEKARRLRLSREAKQKAEKNRQCVQESFLKTTHAQRQEAAQQRREERARERKERLLAEEDPERQRRLEKLELKKERKKMQPRMKQLKIKAA